MPSVSASNPSGKKSRRAGSLLKSNTTCPLPT